MKESKWMLVRKGGDYESIGKKYGITPVLARLLVNRDVSEEEFETFLHGDMSSLEEAENLKDIKKAASIIKEKIEDRKKIRIIGDYDIDGVCSSFILTKSLKEIAGYIGNKDCIDVVLPHRVEDGYGLNINLIDDAIKSGVDTIITCDNGISAIDEIEYAKEKGLTVIVTDHHEILYHESDGETIYELPKADAIVNPKQPLCQYKFKQLCGGVVAYRFVQVLFKLCGIKECDGLIEMAAFATIGDIMPLTGENRIIVKAGLKKLCATNIIGMRKLIEVCELDEIESFTPYHVGFILGPCINAAGRLDSAKMALDLLFENDEAKAIKLAETLHELNLERKELTEQGVNLSCEYVDSLESIPHVIVVYLKECHESIAGIIAGKIRERYNHPAFVLTKTDSGLKGSGRSIDEYDMHAGLIRCRELFSKFGGHKLAAGISMDAESESEREECVKRLSEALNKDDGLCDDDFVGKIKIDMELPFTYIDKDMINELKLLEPCGMNNRKPVFATKRMKVSNDRVIGKNRNAYKGIASDFTGKSFEFITFGDGDELKTFFDENRECMATFYPDINTFRGVSTVNLNLTEVKSLPKEFKA